jgi:hypothetical protein
MDVNLVVLMVVKKDEKKVGLTVALLVEWTEETMVE